jgi:hypothetical protein
MRVKPFKFFNKSFNPRDYDVEGFTFIGVSIINLDEPGGVEYRKMIYVNDVDGTPIIANIIYEHDEPYHEADVIDVRGNQIFQVPRRPNIIRNENL